MSQPDRDRAPMTFRDALHEARAVLERASVTSAEAPAKAAVLARLDETWRQLASDPPAAPPQASASGATAAKKRDLLSVICHDLKDPLASIVMGAGFLQKVLPSDGTLASARRVVDAIYRSANRMNQIIQDFYDLGKLEQGLISVTLRPCDVPSLVRAVLDTSKDAAAEKRIALEADTGSEPAIAAQCDRARLQQVLQKLIGNAIKFTPEGGRVTVRVVPGEHDVTFRVEDTGRGIPPDRIDTVFDREANARQVPRDGPGLGLAIVKGLVSLHHGTIRVESTPGVGSTFIVTIPRAEPSASS